MSDGPIRVLWLVKGLGPGGAEQLLLLSAQVADRTRFTHRLIFVRPDKTHLVADFEAAGLVPELLPAHRVRDMRAALAQADVVHAHSPVLASEARLLSLTLPRAQRPVLISTEHNEWTSHRRPTRALNALTSPLDAHRWAVSEQVRDTTWATHRRRYEVLIHGIDPQALVVPDGTRERLRRELAVADDEVLVLTVANLRANKDYPNLMRAAQLALPRAPRLRFVAVGQGPLADEMAARHAELGLGDRFWLAGYRRDIPELMAAADVFALASAHEGLPVAVMEAFAAGLPVVATRVGGIPGQVRDGVDGLLVPRRDAQALAAAFVTIAGDDAGRSAMGAAARESAGRYDIRVTMARQETMYRRLAGRSRAQGTGGD
ncbi:glycosyltransferase [Nostocoides vanveenii]|uniref:Glycosyltransferase n=1 Tax=Nostocoides vanveenii TaxID=330835 RepID=A0ABP4X5U3_9MICO